MARYTGPRSRVCRRLEFPVFESPKFSNPMQTDYVTGCCLFTSNEVMNQLNGFNEQFDMYGEDVDLCLRAHKMGINCYYWPDAMLWHQVSASLGGNYSISKMIKKIKSCIRLIKIHRLGKI